MGKSTISMVIFNSKLLFYHRVYLSKNPPPEGWGETPCAAEVAGRQSCRHILNDVNVAGVIDRL